MPDSPDTPPARAGRSHWQLGLRGMILFTAVCAVWMTVLLNRRHNALLEARIATMRPLARELVVEDPAKVAVVKLDELWDDDHRWDLYLPPGRYRLCLATRQIVDQGLAPVVASQPIGPGRHLIGLALRKQKTGWRIEANCDGARPIAHEEPLEWNPERGSSTTGGYAQSATLPANQPVVLHRLSLTVPPPSGTASATSVPAEGILLWVEPVTGAAGGR